MPNYCDMKEQPNYCDMKEQKLQQQQKRATTIARPITLQKKRNV